MYFDELDKISESLKGQELAGTQTHLTDVAQNDTFQDRYLNCRCAVGSQPCFKAKPAAPTLVAAARRDDKRVHE